MGDSDSQGRGIDAAEALILLIYTHMGDEFTAVLEGGQATRAGEKERAADWGLDVRKRAGPAKKLHFPGNGRHGQFFGLAVPILKLSDTTAKMTSGRRIVSRP